MHGCGVLKQLASRARPVGLRSHHVARGRRGTVRCAAESTPLSKVNFRVTTHVEFGQRVEVTGDAVGGWEASKPLEWTEGDVWTCDCEVPAGPVEYKYVIKTVDGALLGWQPGSNRHIEVPEGTSITVSDGWDSETSSVTPSSEGGGTKTMSAAEATAAVETNPASAVAQDMLAAQAVTAVESKAENVTDIIEEVIEKVEDIAEEIVEDIIDTAKELEDAAKE